MESNKSGNDLAELNELEEMDNGLGEFNNGSFHEQDIITSK